MSTKSVSLRTESSESIVLVLVLSCTVTTAMNALRQSFKGLFLSGDVASDISSSSTKTPLLRADFLSDTQRLALQHLKEQFPAIADGELLGYLKVRNWHVADAVMQLQASQAWEGSISPTIADVACFMRGAPDGCIVCLEDMKGDCARDALGRPIVLSIGMLHGSLYEQKQQMVYALRRARHYYKNDAQIHSNCVVIEVIPRPGAKATFRFPDQNTKQLMEMQKHHFPGTLSSTTHFCGVPSAVTWAFALCKPFMDAEAYNNMVLRPDFSHLTGSGYLDKCNALRSWGLGGGFDFDLDSYIQWRASEECVVPNDVVRHYDPSNAHGESLLEKSLLQVPANEQRKRAIRSAKVSKRGGGVGLFSSFKWKPKLLMLLPGVLLYFDDLDEESDSLPSTAIALAQGAHTRVVDFGDRGSATWAFEVVAPGRTYTFACDSEDDRRDWTEAINAACA